MPAARNALQAFAWFTVDIVKNLYPAHNGTTRPRFTAIAERHFRPSTLKCALMASPTNSMAYPVAISATCSSNSRTISFAEQAKGSSPEHLRAWFELAVKPASAWPADAHFRRPDTKAHVRQMHRRLSCDYPRRRSPCQSITTALVHEQPRVQSPTRSSTSNNVMPKPAYFSPKINRSCPPDRSLSHPVATA